MTVPARNHAARPRGQRVSYPGETDVKPSGTTLLIVHLSDSFSELWGQISHDLGVDVRVVSRDDVGAIGTDIAAVLVAAGGAEREAVEWLDSHELPPSVPALVVGADPGRRIATLIVGHGAADYFALPEDLEVLHSATSSIVDRRHEALRRSGASAEFKPEAFEQIIGESAALKAVLARANRLLPHADATALIVGETGTGKELLARAIHDGGPRRAAPFVAVNCSALPQNLIESELFGHEKGAFTDAHASKPGLFEVAEGGTLFLDEIGTLAQDLQAKLLRVLEDKMVRRVGSTKWRRANVRILAATNERLRDAVREGSFRQDLYFRLSVVTLELPPLRDRGDDAVLIAVRLLQRAAGQYGLPVPQLDASAKQLLRTQSWPGNVRELKNAVERALLLSPPGELDLSELVPVADSPVVTHSVIPFPSSLDHIVQAAATAMLEACDGNRSEAARRLGISRRRLRRLLALGGDEEDAAWDDPTQPGAV